MTAAAAAFVAALSEAQRGRACFAFGDERRDWSFLPAQDRDGLPIGALATTALHVVSSTTAGHCAAPEICPRYSISPAFLGRFSTRPSSPPRHCFPVGVVMPRAFQSRQMLPRVAPSSTSR